MIAKFKFRIHLANYFVYFKKPATKENFDFHPGFSNLSQVSDLNFTGLFPFLTVIASNKIIPCKPSRVLLFIT